MKRQNWFEVDGDNTLALDWPLTDHSIVWEIGGFEGRWAQQIWDKYGCFVRIFEPQLWAAQKMQEKFKDTRVFVEPWGLWTETCVLPIGNYHTDGASVLKDDGREEKQLGAFLHYKEAFGTDRDGWYDDVDLALMNIEGAEYILIPELIKSDMIYNFKNFWCQFHPVDETDNRHEYIFDQMAETHEIVWDCFPTAVAWRKK